MGGQTLAPLFSPSGESLALASADGIIRIYDTGTGRLKASLGQGNNKTGVNGADTLANGHLVEKNTCLVWATSGRKKKKAVSWNTLLLVGTASGDVKAFDPLMGELKWRAQGLMDGGVSALAHSSKKPGVVLAAGASGQILTLSTETGEASETFKASAHAITCLAVSADGGHAFGGGSSLALWNLSNQERVAKYTGHVVPASSCVFVPGGRAAASVCPGERHVALWAMPPGTTCTLNTEQDEAKVSKVKKSLRPTATTLSMPEAPVQLDVCSWSAEGTAQANGEAPQGNGVPAGDASGSFCLAAVSEGGEAYVWDCGTQGALEGVALQGSLVTMVRVGPQAGATGLTDRILAAKLVPSGTAGLSLLVARGSTARPVFETVGLPHAPAPGGDQPSSNVVTLAPAAAGALLPGRTPDVAGPSGKPEAQQPTKAVKRKGVDVTVVGPGSDLTAAPMMRTTGVAAATAHAGSDKGTEQAEEEEDDVDMAPESLQPLGERVAALTIAARGGPAGASSATQMHEDAPAGPQASDKANSLAVLLTQALRSNDRSLLERCLSSTSHTVITNTVARLLPIDAAAFLRAAVDRLLSSPARAGQLAPWVRALLHHHTGYIMSAPGAQAPLAALYQAIDARVSVYSQLLRLHGRLGLVTAHARAASTPGFGVLEPETVFQDQEEGLEGMEVEDPFALGDDDDDNDNDDDGEIEEESGEGEEGSQDEWEEDDGGDLLDDDEE